MQVGSRPDLFPNTGIIIGEIPWSPWEEALKVLDSVFICLWSNFYELLLERKQFK